MESFLCSHDVVFLRSVMIDPVFPRHLDHTLISLCPGILEEDLVHPDSFAHLLGQQRLRYRIGIVESVHNVLHLLCNRLDHPGIAVPGAVDRHAAVEIQISVALLVIEVHPLCPLCDKIVALIGLHHVLVHDALKFLCRQVCVFQFHVDLLLFLIPALEKASYLTIRRLCLLCTISYTYVF